MNKSITIRYLPNGTTKEDIQEIRDSFKKTHSKDCKLILFVSGNTDIKDSLQNFLDARK